VIFDVTLCDLRLGQKNFLGFDLLVVFLFCFVSIQIKKIKIISLIG
jgi:hypothetical protein